MRWREIIAEAWGEGRRFWISPEGVGYDICQDGQFSSHDKYIQDNPDLFGMQALDFVGRGWPSYVIAKAENKGWVRIACDLRTYAHGAMAISAKDEKHAAKGVRWLHKKGLFPPVLEIEIEVLDGYQARSNDFFVLRDEEIDLFARNGVRPVSRAA